MYVGYNAFACTIDFRSKCKLNFILPKKQCNTWVAKLNKRIDVNPIDIICSISLANKLKLF